jgi:hypothetical protein
MAIGYLNAQRWRDYRGGVSFSRNVGASLGAEHRGFFFETTDDAVYISHFNNDEINYSQNKAGYTTPFDSSLGAVRMQTFWTANVTVDVKRQYWANFIETGPGARFHLPGMPQAMSLTVSAVHGVYLVNEGNPRRPNFNDVRAGVWYAFTK